jgi:hypothetical protein
MDGRFIRHVLSAKQDEGRHELNIPTENIAPGIYFLNISTNGKINSIRKCVKQ